MNKSKRTIITILVMVILFVLPAGSWLYLRRGLDYRKESMAELSDLGKVSGFQLKNQRNLLVTPEKIRSKVSVVHFLSADFEKNKEHTDRIAKVHQSFNDTEDVLFLSFVPADSTTKMLDLAISMGITDDKQWYLIGTDEAEWQRLANDVYKIPNPENDVVLVDTSLTIRKYYDINQNKDMGRLVEHIAIVIPEQKRR